MRAMEKKAKTPVQHIIVEPDYADQRIDNFLFTRLKSVPKTRVYRILRKGEVRVNKKRVEASYRLQPGDDIRIPPLVIEEKEVATPSYSAMNILKDCILFEDKNLMIINKPAGIAVHGGSKVKLGVVEILRTMNPKLPQLELVHRLDADTSGCLVLAKKRGVLKEIHRLLREGKVHKVYWALTKGHWDDSELTVDVPLLKNTLSGGERIVRVNRKEGKESLTIFAPLKEFKNATLVQATLMTGRTHQIRVHAQFRGHPIAGDEKYGDKEFNKQMRAEGLKRMFLHSRLIEFTLPSTGQHVRVEAPLEKALESYIK